MGWVGIRTVVFYLTTTGVVMLLGLTMGTVLQLGVGLDLEVNLSNSITSSSVENQSVSDTLVNLIPKNLIQALVSGNVLQLIVFAILLGLSLNLIGDKGKPVIDFFKRLAEAIYKFTEMVMKLAPYGIFSLIVKSENELDIGAMVKVHRDIL